MHKKLWVFTSVGGGRLCVYMSFDSSFLLLRMLFIHEKYDNIIQYKARTYVL